MSNYNQGMGSPNYSGISGAIIVDTAHRDHDIVVRADTEIFRKVLQTSSAITLRRVTRIVDRLGNYMAENSPQNIEVDVATWSCRGEIEGLTFANGVVSITLNTYGPGDKWTKVWIIQCDQMDVETRYLMGRTLQALIWWIRGQWVIWAALILIAVFLLARLFEKK